MSKEDIIQMGEDMGYTPEQTLHQIATVLPRPARQRRDVDQAAKLANQHEAGTGHRVPRAGNHAWACRDCDFTV
jgi:hypothetical protein